MIAGVSFVTPEMGGTAGRRSVSHVGNRTRVLRYWCLKRWPHSHDHTHMACKKLCVVDLGATSQAVQPLDISILGILAREELGDM